jgi:hypothetical protein
LIDLRKVLDGGGIGDTHEDYDPLAEVACGVFGLCLLIAENASLVYPEHFCGKVVDGRRGA